MKSAIIGTGSYLPKQIIKNDEFTKYMETSDEWISTRTGIRQRYIAFSESNVTMSIKAAKNAIENAKIENKDIDLIICATISGDKPLPSVACRVREGLGIECPAFDLNAACSGFIYGLETADAFLKKDTYKNILVIGSEKLSSIVDWKDRSTCVLFGDGAGATVVSKREDGIMSEIINAIDDTHKSLDMNSDEYEYENLEEMFENNDKSLKRKTITMQGKDVFKFATLVVGKTINDLLEKAKLKAEEVDLIIPHQANFRIIEYAAKRTNIDINKFYMNIDKVGNMSSASIPVALDMANKEGRIKKGNNILLVGFGGGLTYGGILLKWV